jgi:hypothetical protein
MVTTSKHAIQSSNHPKASYNFPWGKELGQAEMETQLQRQVPTIVLECSQLLRIIMFSISQGLDFHGTLSLLGTYDFTLDDL